MGTASSAVGWGGVFWASAAVVLSKKVIRSRIAGLDARGAPLEAILRERCRSVGRPNITGASRELVIGKRSVIRPQSVPMPLTSGQGRLAFGAHARRASQDVSARTLIRHFRTS